jgi:hypothetical protein
MIGISFIFIGVVIALAVIAIAAFFFLLKARLDKRQRPQPWEKAAIMRKLLAASERETGLVPTSPSLRLRASTLRPANADKEITGKSTFPMRAKIS